MLRCIQESVPSSLDELASDATNILDNSKLVDFLRLYHESWRSEDTKSLSQKAKGKQKATQGVTIEDRLSGRIYLSEFPEAVPIDMHIYYEDPDTLKVYEMLESVKLQSWKYVYPLSFFCCI